MERTSLSAPGEFRWPYPGNSAVRPWGVLLAAYGDFDVAADTLRPAAFGESRTVSWSATVHFHGAALYSVPDRLCDSAVWVRTAAGEVVVAWGEGTGGKEVARHDLVGPGCASICDAHYTHRRSADPFGACPSAEERRRSGVLGARRGSQAYLVEAAAVGARRIETRMAEALSLSAIPARRSSTTALGVAAIADASSERRPRLDHRPRCRRRGVSGTAHLEHSLAAGTAMWSALGADDEAEEDGDEGLPRRGRRRADRAARLRG